jgi:hypothetical protein
MTLRRTALLVLPTIALSLTGVNAHAAAYSWTTLTTTSGGKVQACRVPTATTDPYAFRFRVNAVKATTKVQGSAMRYRGTTKLSGGWTSAYIRPGQVSDVAVVKLPRGTAYYLSVGINTGQSGNGGSFKAGDIPRC